MRQRFPDDLTGGGRSRVVVDQYTGEVLYAEGSRTAPAGRKIVIVNRAIHTGEILGLPGKILVALTCILALVQVVSGFMLWWKKRKIVGGKTAGDIAEDANQA